MLAVQIILDSDDYVIAGDMNVFTGQTHRPTLVADDEDSYNGMPLGGSLILLLIQEVISQKPKFLGRRPN